MRCFKIFIRVSIALLTKVLITACAGIPEGIQPVAPFNIERYTGKWYEIARLDHSFEQGLSNVTAEYELQADGNVKVTNRGYSDEDNEWDEADGKAKFAQGPNQGYLKVSFFGPFYSSYVIFELGSDYDYAFVTGPNKKYLWFLARTPTVDKSLMKKFKSTASGNGFNLSELIIVDHSPPSKN